MRVSYIFIDQELQGMIRNDPEQCGMIRNAHLRPVSPEALRIMYEKSE